MSSFTSKPPPTSQVNNPKAFDANIQPQNGQSTKNSRTIKSPLALLFGLLFVLVVILISYLILKPKIKNLIQPAIVTTTTTPAEITITSAGFLPASISINLGQAAVWTNDDNNPHQIASDPYPKDNLLPYLNSEIPIKTGQAYTYIFNQAGTFTYHDNLNPYTFKGTVVVK